MCFDKEDTKKKQILHKQMHCIQTAVDPCLFVKQLGAGRQLVCGFASPIERASEDQSKWEEAKEIVQASSQQAEKCEALGH